MNQKKWQKNENEVAEVQVEAVPSAEVKKSVPQLAAEQMRQAAEPETPINGYSAAFINDKAAKLLGGDHLALKMNNPSLKESVTLRALQLIAARLKKLEQELGV